MATVNKPNISVKRSQRKVHSMEELSKLSKEQLIERIVQVEQHNLQLKNIISKSEDEQNGKKGQLSSRTRKRTFDFTKCSRRHVFLKLLYLGWDYQGFTVQEDTTKTIEHHLFSALVKSCLIEKRENSNYHRCGRTDKGVSAFCQVVSLDIRSKLTEEQLAADNNITEGELDYPKILNGTLPPNIRILGWCPVASNLSARFDCKQRTYKYVFPRGTLDIVAMNTAAQYFVGVHDFRNFCKMDVGNGVTNFERNVVSVSLKVVEHDSNCHGESAYDMCELTITGTAFLWHQVRCMMGVLLLVGESLEQAEVVKDLLDIEKNPLKPQYQLASYLPLNLFDCQYESVDWIINKDVVSNVVKVLQHEWCKYNVKSRMLRAMLQYCEDKFPGQLNMTQQASCLFQGVSSKLHKPLVERQKCSSLETRILHYVKKKKLEVVPSDAETEVVPSNAETEED